MDAFFLFQFDMGAYCGNVGEYAPMIEMQHASGARLRFFKLQASGRYNTVRILATGAVESRSRNFREAMTLFETALDKGYSVKRNIPGGIGKAPY